jgi:hypothetical protein
MFVEEYSDRDKRNAAYELLINKLKEIDPDTNKDNVVKNNFIRTCFRKELK